MLILLLSILQKFIVSWFEDCEQFSYYLRYYLPIWKKIRGKRAFLMDDG